MARLPGKPLAGRALAAALMCALAQATPPAAAETWRFRSSIAAQATATSNVNLSSSNNAREDLVTEITPSFSVTETGAHTSFNGRVSVPILLYARTGEGKDHAYPSANLLGTAELVDGFFYVDGAVSIAQEFFSPFGARPPDFANSTQNRYRTDTYKVSPYIRGVTPNEIAYELRNNNVWNNLSGAPIATSNSHLTQWIGTASNASPTKIGWSAYAESSEIRYRDQRPILMRLARLKPSYRVDPEFQVWVSGGYEDNRFTLTESSGAIYGAGFDWRPTPRTNVVGNYEHRFFGASYLFTFDHRTPLSVWSVRVSRDITTYTQQLGTLPAGIPIGGIVEGLFLARFPDPAERQRAIDEFIRERGLPDVLSSPLALYTQQVLLQESQSATAGILGARNSLLFTIFNVRSEPITGSGNTLPAPLVSSNNNTQTGANLVWSQRLTPSTSLSVTLRGYRTVGNDAPEVTTRQGSAHVLVSTMLSPRTSAYVGARYQELRSDVATEYNESAVFVGMSYVFE